MNKKALVALADAVAPAIAKLAAVQLGKVKTVKIVTEERADGSLTVRLGCPACGCEHYLKAHPSGRMDLGSKTWGWNLSHERPTFSPSLVFDTDDGEVCHAWIRNGEATFIDDSTAHDKGGQTLPLLTMR